MKGKQNRNRARGRDKATDSRKQATKDSRSKRVNFDNERESKFEKTCASNDVSWYVRNAEMLKSAASFPFSTYAGQNFPVSGNLQSVPGIMPIYYDIAIGGYNESQSIQQAKESLYSYVVHANSRNQSYDPTDLFMLILAGNELFRAIAHGIRAYGTMKTYYQQNEYAPRGLIKAMGFDYDNLKMNLSKMWFDINNIIAQAAQIWVPNDLPFIKRQFWMNSHIYMDGESIKSQMYLYVPQYFYQYNTNYASNGSGLEPISSSVWSPTNTQVAWGSYVSMMQTMIDRMITDSDRGMIFGDILKAYGADRIYAISEISSDYTVVPVYDREVLWQINNLHALPLGGGGIYQTESGLIKKDYDILKTSVTGKFRDVQYSLLNFFQKEDPTPEQVMVATRMTASQILYNSTPSFPGHGNTYVSIAPFSCGTELATGFGIINMVNGSPSIEVIRSSVVLSSEASLTFYQYLTQFDWAPYVYVVPSNTPAPTDNDGLVVPAAILGDVENWMQVGFSLLTKTHTTAVYSEYGVPIL